VYQNLYSISSVALMSFENINEPYCDTFQSKTVVHMKTVFSASQHQLSEKMNVVVFMQGNISVKPKSWRGREAK